MQRSGEPVRDSNHVVEVSAERNLRDTAPRSSTTLGSAASSASRSGLVVRSISAG